MTWEVWVLVLNAIGFNLVWNMRPSWAQTDGFASGAMPLAVRSPYLNCWLDTTDATRLVWPSTWNNLSLGWTGYARVDGVAYQWMGEGGNPAMVSSRRITPIRTIVEAQAGPVLLNITYLSPVEPSDLVLQSFPFSYLAVGVISTDGASHSVQLYSDITGDFVSANKSTVVQWNTTVLENSIYHQMRRVGNGNLNKTEIDEVAEGGAVYLAMQAAPGLSWSIKSDVDVRTRFQSFGDLDNTTDSPWRAIEDRTPTMALSVDLGNVFSSSSPVVWGLGVVHEPSVQYIGETGPQERFPLYASQYSTMDEAIGTFAGKYSAALNVAVGVEIKVLGDAHSISPQYADLVSLATRQVFGALDITISQDGDGQWNMSDIKVFMKDIGFSQRVNPLDTIYAALPALLYFNNTLPGLLLDPLIQYQGFWLEENDCAAPDLGIAYPSALGDGGAVETSAFDSTASMLIIAYAHASYSGDGSLIFKYYGLLKRYAEFLAEQVFSSPGFDSFGVAFKPNNTNIVIKGIIALRAMAGISGALGRTDDSQRYEAKASSYAGRWHDLAVTQDHVMSTFNDPESWAMSYNLFSDLLLKTKVVDETVFQKQDAFYQSLSSTAPPYGLPVDTNSPGIAQSHWTMFTAAAAVNQVTRDTLINMVHVRTIYNLTFTPNPVSYDPNSGAVGIQGGIASPAQGAIFAPLVLSLPLQEIKVPKGILPLFDGQSGSTDLPTDAIGASGKTTPGVVAAIVVGTFLGFAAFLVVLLVLWKKRRLREREVYCYSTVRWQAEGRLAPIPAHDIETDPSIQSHTIVIPGIALGSPPFTGRPSYLWYGSAESQPLSSEDLRCDQAGITVEQTSEPLEMSNSFNPYEGHNQLPQMLAPVRRAESGVEWGGITIADPSTPGSSYHRKSLRSNLSRSDTRTTAASRRKNGSEVAPQ